MIIASICLFVAIAGLVAVFYYGWWSIIRVIRFRHEIGMKRDELIDCTASLHALNDPTFSLALDTFNSVASAAHHISLRSIEYMSSAATPVQRVRSKNTELQQFIDDATDWLIRRITHYIMKESLRGILYSVAYGSNPVHSIARRDIERKVSLVVGSDIVSHWDRAEHVRVPRHKRAEPIVRPNASPVPLASMTPRHGRMR
jgi:hypothetical protein